jgi:hypothetical protein
MDLILHLSIKEREVVGSVSSKTSQADYFYLGTDEHHQDNGHLVKFVAALDLECSFANSLHILPILSQKLNLVWGG